MDTPQRAIELRPTAVGQKTVDRYGLLLVKLLGLQQVRKPCVAVGLLDHRLIIQGLSLVNGPWSRPNKRRKSFIFCQKPIPNFRYLGYLRRPHEYVSTSFSADRRKFRKSSPWYSQVWATVKRVRYSSTPFFVDVPEITSRSLANALMACSALLLFHGTPS